MRQHRARSIDRAEDGSEIAPLARAKQDSKPKAVAKTRQWSGRRTEDVDGALGRGVRGAGELTARRARDVLVHRVDAYERDARKRRIPELATVGDLALEKSIDVESAA